MRGDRRGRARDAKGVTRPEVAAQRIVPVGGSRLETGHSSEIDTDDCPPSTQPIRELLRRKQHETAAAQTWRGKRIELQSEISMRLRLILPYPASRLVVAISSVTARNLAMSLSAQQCNDESHGCSTCFRLSASSPPAIDQIDTLGTVNGFN
ncbi:protein of unknown function [Paraburkholderia kururiensis]